MSYRFFDRCLMHGIHGKSKDDWTLMNQGLSQDYLFDRCLIEKGK